MYFRSRKKTAGDVSLSDALDVDGEGLSIMDVLAEDDDMAERIINRQLCGGLRRCMDEQLTEKEKKVLILRYGLGGGEEKTQQQTADICGISRSYVSRIEKKALQKLKAALNGEENQA